MSQKIPVPKSPVWKERVRRPVEQINLRTGDVIATFPSQLAASKATGVQQGHISMVCNGNWDQSGGFSWRFVVIDPDTLMYPRRELNSKERANHE